MPEQITLSRCSRLANERGAAFLLAIYFTSLTLFLLGGVSLQRTMVEVRAAQVSRNARQAFYLAEASLDQALVDLAEDVGRYDDGLAVALQPSLRGTLPGTASFTVLQDPDDASIRTIRATAIVNGIAQQVRMTLVEAEPAPFEGLFAGGQIFFRGPPTAAGPDDYLKVYGRVHAAGGTGPTIELTNTKLYGPVSIGEPHADPILWMLSPYTSLYGRTAGAGIQMVPGVSEDDHLAALPTAETLMPLVSNPDYGARPNDTVSAMIQQDPAAYCQRSAGAVVNGSLGLDDASTMTVADGDALDVTPAGDGKIAICLSRVSLSGDSRLTFTAPATMYLTASSGNVYSQAGNAVVESLAGGSAAPNNVEVVLPAWAKPPPSQWGWAGRFELEEWATQSVMLMGGTLRGSIWAPYAEVKVWAGAGPAPVNVFGEMVTIYAPANDQTLRFGPPEPEGGEFGATASAASSRPYTITSWSN